MCFLSKPLALSLSQGQSVLCVVTLGSRQVPCSVNSAVPEVLLSFGG